MMADRKAELERKKAKLQAIREEKQRRKLERLQKETDDSLKSSLSSVKSGNFDSVDVDQVLSSVGIPPIIDYVPNPSVLSHLSSPEPSIEQSPEVSLASESAVSKAKKKALLTVVTVQQTNIAPKESVIYDKGTQTAQNHVEREAHGFDYYVLTYDDLQAEDEDSLHHLDHPSALHSKLPPGVLHPGMPNVEMVKPALTVVEESKKEDDRIPEPKDISEEEKQMITMTEDFQKFMDRTSRIIERALCEETDIFVDYSGGLETDSEGEEKTGQRLSLNRWFYDDRWSKNRTVTSMDWSPQFPELLVASYNNNSDSPHDPDGVVLVWNTKFKKSTPEYIFHCQSSVMSSTFARFHPNLIIGGTYSGQVVLWDNRVQKRTPVQRSPLSASAHTHPVYCLKVVGTQNAHNLISISTDGKLCSWSLDMLSQPQETLELQHKKQSRAIAVTSMAFPSNDVNNFIVGSEEGTVYTACRHGSKAGINDQYEGHQGPVTGIDTHDVMGPVDLSHLFITSSFDWTIKLWSLKEQKPLYSFEDNGDYVYDVAWSPIHPAMFAAIDGTGKLDLWNLNNDSEVPTASVTVEGNPALNRVSWTQSGLHITVGDDLGKIWTYDVNEHLAVPHNDEWTHLFHTLQELKNNVTEEEMENSRLNSPMR